MNRLLKNICIGLLILLVGVSCKMKTAEEQSKSQNSIESIVIDDVWAANRVYFSLETVGEIQFVAYYNKNRMMTVASRKLGSKEWTKVILNNKLKWDSHNYVVLAVDQKGYIHVSGNMHADPLIYYRSEVPYDIKSMAKVRSMVGRDENDVTYPKFFNNHEGDLLYMYRSGSSGNGKVLVNKFDTEKQTWERYLNTPLFNGIDENSTRSAYHRSVKGPDGYFHYVWMWRWTPLVETCHQLCYAKSPDLIHWENIRGEKVELPLTPDDERLIVDPAPTKGGLTNARYSLVFTPDKKPIIGYVKYDEEGLTQLYLASFIDDEWKQSKISNWDFRWKFVGGGDQMTRGGQFNMAGFTDDGLLVIDWETETNKSGRYVVDPVSLGKVNKEVVFNKEYPDELKNKMSDNPELFVQIKTGKGMGSSGEKYVLKWEAMKPSHGKHKPEIIPSGPLSKLLLLTIEE